MEPKTTIISVCEVHIIHPKAKEASSEMPNPIRIALTATGYIPTPPLVAEIENAPAIKAGMI